jgi:alkanesulfonate monooxygenase SsuD/methylene tetrahydromethanopterin reductase-like flavin-dependent oxidoreductase (luciferase family)
MTGLHLAVALDGYGWHPQAWRVTLAADPGAASVLSGRYWTGLAATAERGLLDFLTIDDTLMPQPGRRERIDPGRLAGRADAVLVAARIAPATAHIGLIPVATVTHTEPFHVSKSIATLDYVSHGRSGWQARVSVTTHEAALFGRRDPARIPLFDEAVEHIEVVRRVWDSSITPRPPQGQPVVAALAHAGPVYEFAATSADVVFITPTDEGSLRAILDEIPSSRLKVFADVVVSFEGDADFRSDALVFGGSATELVDLLLQWQRLGIDGARLRPAVNATDLPVIVDEVVPLLQRAGQFRTNYPEGETLRARLGLPVAPNRDAVVHQ